MPTLISDLQRLRAKLDDKAKAEGFASLRVTSAELPKHVGERLDQFVALDYHATMHWIRETKERRKNPVAMWPAARSAIVLAMSYAPSFDVLQRLESETCGTISVYALNRDYHDIVKGKLKQVAQWFAHAAGSEVKVYVDTAPLMEKPLAQQAGLGWQGKHTNLVSRELGSWFFIGVILTTAELAADSPESDHCGSCAACLDICPTKAFPQAGVLDARRCISYLTIEHAGHIDPEFREAMGNRIYGCDDCLAVCPWNKFASIAQDAKLHARIDLVSPPLATLLQLTDQSFRKFFAGSPVKRIGRDRFVRNCLIAAGNSKTPALLQQVEPLLNDQAPVVRAMAVWAYQKLADQTDIENARHSHLNKEKDAAVASEWAAA